MLRRSLLRGAAALPFVGALAACGGRTESQLQADVQAIAAGVQGLAAALYAAVPSIPAETQARINAAIAAVEADAAPIAQALTPGQPVVKDFVESVNELATLVQPYYSAAPKIADVMIAAAALAQVVLTEAGVMTAFPRVPAMTPAQARGAA